MLLEMLAHILKLSCKATCRITGSALLQATVAYSLQQALCCVCDMLNHAVEGVKVSSQKMLLQATVAQSKPLHNNKTLLFTCQTAA